MARITIRDLPDSIHQAIAQAAVRHERSTEGEIRFALQQYAAGLERPVAVQQTSARETWQRETGLRLAQLFDRLRADRVFRYGECHDLPHLARMIGEDSPANLLDCLEGNAASSFDMLRRISTRFGCSESWLTSGADTMFTVERIGNNYREFFLHDRDNKGIVFRLLRISGGRSDGAILCIRHDEPAQTFACGFICTYFYLRAGMGSGGHGNLRSFIRFLKSDCGDRALRAYDYETKHDAAPGDHHPLVYLSPSAASPSRWLSKLFDGEDPADWIHGYEASWQAIKALPFGNGVEEALEAEVVTG